MGLFGGTETFVASTVYNMAGPEEDRPDYLKTVIVGNVISNKSFSMSDTIGQCYMAGPGIKARAFYRWALNNYTEIGVPPMTLLLLTPAANSAILPNLPVGANQTAHILDTHQGNGDISYWGDKWVLDNQPARKAEDYTVTWDGSHGKVTFDSDGFSGTFVPAPTFSGTASYIYVHYNITDNATAAVVGEKVWIYKIGSGNASLDATVKSSSKASHFFPFIPIRDQNTFLSEDYLPDIYEASKKAYRKATSGHSADYDKLIDKIKDNDSIDDIDYAYIVYGVPLNVIDNSARRYLFNFFKALIPDTAGETGTNRIEIVSPGTAVTKLNMTIDWTNIVLSSGSGMKKAGAQLGEVWLQASGDNVIINCQVSKDAWETLTISGLVHNNWVYKSSSVKIKGSEALTDADESGFLVPLHYETIKDMSLVDSTQMMTASIFIVFNSFKTVKQKWYETWAFKIFIFIVIIAITVVTMGAAAPGLLGAAGSVGASLGFTGTMAAIVGAVANALAAMILVQLITMGAVAAFGAKVGSIIAVIASTIAIAVGGSLMSGQSLSAAWGSMMSAQNLLKLTESVGNGIANYMKASAQDIMVDAQQVVDDYQKQSKQIQELFAQNIGYDRGIVDPLSLTDVSFSNPAETSQQFMMRTLMTGSDIAELSMDMLTNFTMYTLDTSLPIGS